MNNNKQYFFFFFFDQENIDFCYYKYDKLTIGLNIL